VSLQVNVGPAVLTIGQGNTFMVTQLDGQIATEGELGVFANDTRFVSYYAIFADGRPWVLLNSATTAYYSARIYLTNPAIDTEGGTIAPGTLALTLNRIVSTGIHEDMDIVNYGLHPVKFNLEIALRADFADIYEVKAHHFVRRGNIISTANEAEQTFSTVYQNGDFRRSFGYQIRNPSSPPHSANGRISFLVELAPELANYAAKPASYSSASSSPSGATTSNTMPLHSILTNSQSDRSPPIPVTAYGVGLLAPIAPRKSSIG
jgi:hypothetical protein